jgi:acetoacetyl-CoA reductase
MDSKTAIVTGGTGGIGTAICQRLAAEYTVIACYFKNSNHEEVFSFNQSQLYHRSKS